MEKSNNKTTSYDATEKFMMDIVELDDGYEAWIYHKDTGIKELMFAVSKDQTTQEEMFDLANANFEDYCKMYKKEYME